ncbi:MAG TPA: sensor domain-containing protein [Ktedonobacteraceae bacterium]
MEYYPKNTTKRTLAGEIAFLMLAFPMSLIFFIVTIVGFSLGMGTLIIWIGLPILFATLYAVHGMAAVERNLVSGLLHMPHAERAQERAQTRGFLRRFGHLLRDPYTWTSMVYMLFIKLPLGIVNFVLVLTFSLVSAALTLLPLVYLLNTFIDSILLKSGVSSAQSILIPYVIEIHGGFDPLMFLRSFACVPLGLIIWFLTRYMIKGLASFSGLLANSMLGPSTAAYNTQPHTQSYMPPMHMMQQHISSERG